MRRVSSENRSAPRASKRMFTTHSTPVAGSVDAKASARSSPLRLGALMGSSVNVAQRRLVQVRSLNSNRAVWPMRALASSMAAVVLRDSMAPRFSARVSRSSWRSRWLREAVLILKVRSFCWSITNPSRPSPSRTLCNLSPVTASLNTTSVREPLAPGSCTITRSSPNCWITGSSVPKRFTRRLIMFTTPSICSGVGFGCSLSWKELMAPTCSPSALRNSWPRPVPLWASLTVKVRSLRGRTLKSAKFSPSSTPCILATSTGWSKVTSARGSLSAW